MLAREGDLPRGDGRGEGGLYASPRENAATRAAGHGGGGPKGTDMAVADGLAGLRFFFRDFELSSEGGWVCGPLGLASVHASDRGRVSPLADSL